MNAEPRTIVLPDTNEMQQRLLSVDDDQHPAGKFYPLLTKHGGQKKNAAGISLMFALAIYDYVGDAPAVLTTVLYINRDL